MGTFQSHLTYSLGNLEHYCPPLLLEILFFLQLLTNFPSTSLDAQPWSSFEGLVHAHPHSQLPSMILWCHSGPSLSHLCTISQQSIYFFYKRAGIGSLCPIVFRSIHFFPLLLLLAQATTLLSYTNTEPPNSATGFSIYTVHLFSWLHTSKLLKIYDPVLLKVL